VTWFLEAGAAMAGAGLVTGLGVPALIARIPEPSPDPELEPDAHERTEDDAKLPTLPVHHEPRRDSPVQDAEAKEPYREMAALPGLAWKCALAGAVVGGLVGARVGWEWALLPLAYLVPVGIALAVVDWRTRLLPTWVIAPSYAAVIVLCLVAALAEGQRDDLSRAAWGWLVSGGTFLLLWLVYPRGMGYGDVRLSGVLGIALGFLGWGELVVGVYAGFVIGGVGGVLLSALRIVDRKAYPFGPFMLVGALFGVLWGAAIADAYVGGL
jgi:leader peptidase (prepilin peptidase)/N-methyltransferase